MKKNKNGFVLFETLVVASFVLGALIFLFAQFSNIKKNYEITFRYNTVPGLYNLKVLSNYISNKSYYANFVSNMSLEGRSGYYVIKAERIRNGVRDDINCSDGGDEFCDEIINKINAKTVVLLESNMTNFQNHLKQLSNRFSDETKKLSYEGFDEEFREFLLSQEVETIDRQDRIAVEYNDNTFAIIAINDIE